MKLWTYYYAKVKDLPEKILPIAISLQVPNGWKYPVYQKIAPSRIWFWDIKEYQGEDKEELYKERYRETVLSKTTPDEVFSDLSDILKSFNEKNNANYKDVALICFEKSGDFCHRNLFASWFSAKGYGICEEFNEKMYKILEFSRKIESYEKDLITFERSDELTTGSPKENGAYLTLRLNPTKIYTSVNWWKNDHWEVGITDGSSVIAHFRKRLTELEEYAETV